MSVAGFVNAATERRCARATAMLEAAPEIERDPWTRLVLGREWAGDPNEPGGPRGWAPLLYVCHSCFGSPALARELLARGADPNASFLNEHGRMSALYGAAGVVHHPELTRVLLEAGANPTTASRCTTRPRRRAPSASGSCSRTAPRLRAQTRSHTLWTKNAPGTSACCWKAAPIRARARSLRTRSGAGAARRCSSSWPSTAPSSTVRAARRGAVTCR